MNRCWLVVPSLVVMLLGAALVQAQETVVKDRKAYFPNRKQVALSGTEIGILLADGQPVLSTEGRSGPADQLVFSSNLNSYRWVYVPTQDNPQITNLQVPVGDKGEKVVYPSLNLANLKSVVAWGVNQPYALVEVNVNTGRGSPPLDSFVGASFKVLDGTKDYPLKVTDAVKLARDRYADHIAKQQKTIDKAMKDAGDKALNGKAPTGPRERQDLMYVTWMTDSNTMRVHFKTRVSDGAYTIINGGGGPFRDPPPLPLPPPPKKAPPKGAVSFESAEDVFVLRPVRPKDFAIKTGTTFGIEFGQAYVINKKGEVVGTEVLPIESFTQQLNAPLGPVGPRPLPPQPVPPAKESI
jgi:hypothetical protein